VHARDVFEDQQHEQRHDKGPGEDGADFRNLEADLDAVTIDSAGREGRDAVKG